MYIYIYMILYIYIYIYNIYIHTHTHVRYIVSSFPGTSTKISSADTFPSLAVGRLRVYHLVELSRQTTIEAEKGPIVTLRVP